MLWYLWKTRLARLDGAGADIIIENGDEVGCGKVDSTGVDGTGAGNRTRDNDRPKVTKSIKVDIIINESKTPILVSS